MKKASISAMFCLAVLVGCGSAPNPMVGTWELELSEKMKSQFPAGMEQPNATLTFKEDGTFEAVMKFGPKSSSASGTYKLEGKKLSMATTKEDGKDKSKDVEEVTLADDMKSFDLPKSGGMGKLVKK